MNEVRKILSANDVGETGGHQAGILVPKDPSVLGFFPKLNSGVKNPRMLIVMSEISGGAQWKFNFIYYNGKLFGGTRNEYRLTRMTGFLRSTNAKVSDELVFRFTAEGVYLVGIERNSSRVRESSGKYSLVLSSGWKIIKS